MTYGLLVSQAAENDLRQSFIWYEEQKGNLGSYFEDQIKVALQTINENPFKFQVKYQDVRVYFLPKFPYGIHYSISKSNIIILAVFHTAQNPENWNNRI